LKKKIVREKSDKMNNGTVLQNFENNILDFSIFL